MKRSIVFLVIATLCYGLIGCAPATQAPTAAPAQPTTAPAQPTAVPAQPTSAPVQATSAPAQPTAAPTQPAAASGTPFVVAVVGPMTGGGAQQGQYAMTGAQIAADEINAAGGINGQPIKLMPMDDQGDPSVAATVAQRLVDDPTVQVVIGHLWSSALLAAEPIYVKAGMPVLTPSASNVQVTHSGYNNVIRVCLNDAMGVPPAIAELVNNEKSKKIAVLYSNDDYGVGALAQAKTTAAQLGAQVVYAGAYKPNVDTDFTVQLTAAVASGADSMFLASQQTEGGLIVSQASKLGVFDKIPNWDANDGVMYQAFLDRVDSTAESHIMVVAPYDPFANRKPVQDFVNKFMAQQQNATPSETAWFSYDALKIVQDAYKAGATRATLIDKIKSMTFTDLLTSNSVTFDKNGDRAVVQMFNLGIKAGKFYSTGTTPDLTGVTFGQ